jgi:hypothetical protein
MGDTNWIDMIGAAGSVATPLFVLVLTAVGWKYRQSIERRLKLEESLRDDRMDIYNAILEPFVIIFMSDAAWKSNRRSKNKGKIEAAKDIFLSLDYRTVSFKLALIAPDAVVRAFNEMLQAAYNQDIQEGNAGLDAAMQGLSLVGAFLLEIRRSMGNEKTKLDSLNMIEWFITDARLLREARSI